MFNMDESHIQIKKQYYKKLFTKKTRIFIIYIKKQRKLMNKIKRLWFLPQRQHMREARPKNFGLGPKHSGFKF